jgi:hypothetical protein
LPEYIKHKNKVFSLLNFDNFINNNNTKEDYIIFDNYLPDKNNNKYRYIVKFTKSKEVSIGRGFEAQLILNDISVSRLHCKINISEKGEILLDDLNSKLFISLFLTFLVLKFYLNKPRKIHAKNNICSKHKFDIFHILLFLLLIKSFMSL